MDGSFFEEDLNVQTNGIQLSIPELTVTPMESLDSGDMLNMKYSSDYYFPPMNLGVESNVTPSVTPSSSIASALEFSHDTLWDGFSAVDPFTNTYPQDFPGMSQNRRRSNSSMSIFDDFTSPVPRRQRSFSNPSDKKRKVFYCHLCPTTFSRNHDLKRHIRIHLGIRPHKCQTCPKSFTRADALHRHVHIRGCRGV
jgi:uncharacterized Zn-finger protein